MDDVLGDWQGVIDVGGLASRTLFHLGTDGATMDLLDAGAIAIPLPGVEAEAGGVTLRFPKGEVVRLALVDGDLLADQAAPGQEAPLRLQRNHPAFVGMDVPREGAVVGLTTVGEGTGWSVGEPETVGLDRDALTDLVGRIVDGEYALVDAVLVARRGTLVVEECFHSTRPDAIHTIQSCTKSVTGLLYGAALQRGLAPSVDTPVWEVFAEARPEARWVREQVPVTIRELLTMSAGLDWNEDVHYTDGRNDNTRMNATADWVGYVLDRDLDSAHAPGAFAYQSGLSILLSGILHHVSGRPAHELADEFLFGPMGIDEWHWHASPAGLSHTGGGLSLRPRDFLKFGQLVLDGGRWAGKQIVPEAWVAECVAPQSARPVGGYGFQWFLERVDVGDEVHPVVQAGGYGGQFLSVVPDLDLVVLSHAKDWFGDGSYGRILRDVIAATTSGAVTWPG